MSDTKGRDSLSVGVVAKRWNVSRERVHAMIRAGKLAAFRVPSAGRFGAALRVPVAAVLAAEAAWAVLPAPPTRPKPPQPGAPFKRLRLPSGRSAVADPC